MGLLRKVFLLCFVGVLSFELVSMTPKRDIVMPLAKAAMPVAGKPGVPSTTLRVDSELKKEAKEIVKPVMPLATKAPVVSKPAVESPVPLNLKKIVPVTTAVSVKPSASPVVMPVAIAKQTPIKTVAATHVPKPVAPKASAIKLGQESKGLKPLKELVVQPVKAVLPTPPATTPQSKPVEPAPKASLVSFLPKFILGLKSKVATPEPKEVVPSAQQAVQVFTLDSVKDAYAKFVEAFESKAPDKVTVLSVAKKELNALILMSASAELSLALNAYAELLKHNKEKLNAGFEKATFILILSKARMGLTNSSVDVKIASLQVLAHLVRLEKETFNGALLATTGTSNWTPFIHDASDAALQETFALWLAIASKDKRASTIAILTEACGVARSKTISASLRERYNKLCRALGPVTMDQLRDAYNTFKPAFATHGPLVLGPAPKPGSPDAENLFKARQALEVSGAKLNGIVMRLKGYCLGLHPASKQLREQLELFLDWIADKEEALQDKKKTVSALSAIMFSLDSISIDALVAVANYSLGSTEVEIKAAGYILLMKLVEQEKAFTEAASVASGVSAATFRILPTSNKLAILGLLIALVNKKQVFDAALETARVAMDESHIEEVQVQALGLLLALVVMDKRPTTVATANSLLKEIKAKRDKGEAEFLQTGMKSLEKALLPEPT